MGISCTLERYFRHPPRGGDPPGALPYIERLGHTQLLSVFRRLNLCPNISVSVRTSLVAPREQKNKMHFMLLLGIPGGPDGPQGPN